MFVGPLTTLANCEVEDNVYIGAGAKIDKNAKIHSLSWIANGAVIPAKSVIVGGGIYAGSPAVRVRDLTPDEVMHLQEVSKKSSVYAVAHRDATKLSPEQIVATINDREEEGSRNPLATYAKNPRMLIPEDRRGMFYDRIPDHVKTV